MTKISGKGKHREGRGTGGCADYKPWIKVREVNSLGTATSVIDYKTGRNVELLSQGEVYWWYYLRWQDDVEDIQEQFPLDLATTVAIADSLGYAHPKDNSHEMTTDLLVTKINGKREAYSVKVNPKALDNPRTLEKLMIEKMYWESQGVPFHMAFKNKLNKTLIQNLIDVLECYDPSAVSDPIGAIRYKIAHKEIIVDMESSPLNYSAILSQYLEIKND